MSSIRVLRFGLFISFLIISNICLAQQQATFADENNAERKARYFTKRMVENLLVTTAQEEALYNMNLIVSQKFDSLNKVIDKLTDKKDRSLAYRKIYGYRDSCMRVILPTKEFLKFQDLEREKYEQKKKQQSGAMDQNKKGE